MAKNRNSDSYADGEISCPFLAMSPPSTRNVWSFVRDAEENGLNLALGLFVATLVTYKQKGLWAVIRLEAPDLHRLREVPGISHDDRYAVYLPELRKMAAEMEVDGRLSLQQLVDMKLWIAEQVGVEVGDASRIETALAFIRAGGDLETWTVDTDEVFTLLSGERPSVDAVVTPSALKRTWDAADWTQSHHPP